MSISNRVAQLEKQHEGEDASGEALWRERWRASYVEIAATMDAGDFSEVHAEIKCLLERVNAGEVSYWSSGSLSFVASRVLSLVHRAANGFEPGLVMPPALAQAWREHDRRFINASPEERHKGSFDSQECADCRAEHPFLGRYERNEAQCRNVIVNLDELIKTCLVCGGDVGTRYSNGFISASERVQ